MENTTYVIGSLTISNRNKEALHKFLESFKALESATFDTTISGKPIKGYRPYSHTYDFTGTGQNSYITNIRDNAGLIARLNKPQLVKHLNNLLDINPITITYNFSEFDHNTGYAEQGCIVTVTHSNLSPDAPYQILEDGHDITDDLYGLCDAGFYNYQDVTTHYDDQLSEKINKALGLTNLPSAYLAKFVDAHYGDSVVPIKRITDRLLYNTP